MEVQMKFLKILGIIVLVLIVVFVVLALVAPKKYSVERSVVIDAPRQLVFNHVRYWRNWKDWSPWAKMDSAMTVTVEGQDGEVGSIYKWQGDPKLTGKGEMTNTGLKDDSEITYHLHFIEPWESESDGYVRATDTEGGTQVTWAMYGESPIPWNVFMLFSSMDKMIGGDFEKGLQNLKTIAEKEAKAVLSYKIQKVKFPARKYAAIRSEVAFSDMSGFYAKSYQDIEMAIRKKFVRKVGAPAGLYYTWDEQNMKSDMAAGIPVNRPVGLGNVKTISLPASTAYLVDYYGSYEGSIYAYEALDLYFSKNGLKMKPPVVEEYITNPQAETDTSKWLTKIYFFAE
jgi:effector-binding domain-containing protein